MLVKLDLSRKVPLQLERGVNVVTMSRTVMPGTQPLIEALDAANADLAEKEAAAVEARQAAEHADDELDLAAAAQRVAFGLLGSHVNSVAEGSTAFILSTGYGVRANATPLPPITEPPANVSTQINGIPGQVVVRWKKLRGARNYEVQSTTDLTGVTGWISIAETPGKTRANVNGLVSGTRYAFRVRALGNGMPGPWSGPVQQMAP